MCVSESPGFAAGRMVVSPGLQILRVYNYGEDCFLATRRAGLYAGGPNSFKHCPIRVFF